MRNSSDKNLTDNIPTAHYGTNAKVIKACSKLYIPDGAMVADVRIFAERKLGLLLLQTRRNPGTRCIGDDSGGSVLAPPEDTPTLEELGLKKKDSSIAQIPSAGCWCYFGSSTSNGWNYQVGNDNEIFVHFPPKSDQRMPNTTIQKTMAVRIDTSATQPQPGLSSSVAPEGLFSQ